jgi:glucosamine-6-phosphate deaminase
LDHVCRTQQVNDGCFTTFDDVPARAITITMSTIMHVRQTICVVPGKLKAQAINNMLNGEITTHCPASILRQHDNSVLYLDMDSASLALK